MKLRTKLLFMAVCFALVLPLVFNGSAVAGMYMTDGTIVSGGIYQNPNDGACVIGVAADGTMLIDTSITNARDCAAYTKNSDGSLNLGSLSGTTTACQDANHTDNTITVDGKKYRWGRSTSLCMKDGDGLSRVDLDNTAAMCTAKGGTIVTTGKCVANNWQYMNRKPDGTLAYTTTPTSKTNLVTTKGPAFSDNLGFCYTTMRMNSGTYTNIDTCPSSNNIRCVGGTSAGNTCSRDAECAGGGLCIGPGPNETTWPACNSTTFGCQTPASYNEGLGWLWVVSGSRCNYAYGQKGLAHSALTDANADTYVAAGGTADLTGLTTMGDCLSKGASWDNWLIQDGNRKTVTPTGGGGDLINDNLPAGAQIVKPDTTTLVKDGGGNFHTGTGAVCQKCHSDQSRSYYERYKPGYVNTGHKWAGDEIGSPWTAATSDWGLQGVQCNVCHGTARPGQDDIIQWNPTTDKPKYASGHMNLALGSTATQLCFYCHGAPTVPDTNNPAQTIPVASGEFALTGKGLAPIGNQFLNSPHAKYTGTSTKQSLATGTNYFSPFVGYNCRLASWSGSYLSTVFQSGAAHLIHFLDSTTNPDCTNAATDTPSGAAGVWQAEGSAASDSRGNCTTCHDVHWSLGETNPKAEPLRRECTTCHMNSVTSASSAPQYGLNPIKHPGGVGTPAEHYDPLNPKTANHACETCHMPKLTSAGSHMHLWRISTDASYVTAGESQANLVAGEAFVDLNASCGQCHGSSGSAHLFNNTALAAKAAGMHSGTQWSTDCATCHTDQATAPINHRLVMGIPGDCAACHAGARAGVKPTAAQACNPCHNPPVTGAPYISPENLAARATGIHRATPDLVISYLSIPTQTSPDSVISVTDSTKNRGGGTAGASTTAFYLSTNTTCGDGDTLLSLTRSVPSLAGGATSTGTTSVTIPGGTAVGTYYICAHADNGEVVAESSETNNTRVSIAISVVANNVDLVISSVSAPTSAKKGANITVSDATKNRLAGTAGASTTRVYLSADAVLGEGDVSLGTRAVPSLAGGATSTGSIVVTIPGGTVAGSYYLIWKADDGAAVAETDENNNTRSKAITIVN